MAKAKADLFKDAQQAGVVPVEAGEDDYTRGQLEALLSGDIPVHERQSYREPQVAPDGHVVLSQEDIDARDS